MISFVYFDLGGVVIRDFSKTDKWQELKNELGITSKKDLEFEEFWKKYEPDLCVGRDVETLKPLIEEKFDLKLPKYYSLLTNGFVNRFRKNLSIWPVVNRVKKSCPIGLLTNMYPGMLNSIKKHNLLPDVEWDAIIDSSVVELQKPDLKIFELAEQRASVKGQEILFIGNTPGHVKSASELSWQTFLYDPADLKNSSQKLLEFWKTISG